MGGMSAETAAGMAASRGSYPMLPMGDLDVLAAELRPRSMARLAERRLMGTMPGEQPRHFAEVPWLPPVPSLGTAEPIPPSRRLAVAVGDNLSGLASGVSDSLAEWRRRKDVAEYQALPGWQKPFVAATDMADVLADGVTFGFGNKLAAALETLTSEESYDELLAKNRALTEAAKNRAGLAGDAIGLVGGLRSGKSLVDAGLGLSRWAPKAVHGAPKPDLLKRLGDFGKTSALAAADGAAVGALDAIGHGTDVGTGAGVGGGIGFVMPGAFKAVGAVVSPLVDMVSSSPAVKRMVADFQANSRVMSEPGRRASRAGTYDPLGAPQRPFKADYPKAPKYRPANGRLVEDIDGRPLTARIIVGRRTKDGPDVALTPDEVRDVGFGARVIQYEFVDPGDVDLGPDPAAILVLRDPDTNEYLHAHIKTDSTQSDEDIPRLEAHETGHAVDEIVLQIPIDGVEDELRLVYSALGTGKWSPTPTRSPESDGYATHEVRDELMAEGIRAYMTDPNWFKSVAPNAAKRIREKVNPNTDINRTIQFNSLGATGIGGLGAGMGAGGVLDAEEETEPRRSTNKL
jgi:hypothetical protein